MKANKKIVIFSSLLTAILITVSFFCFPAQSNSPTTEPNKPPIEVLQEDPVKILLVGDMMFDRGIRYYANENGGNDFIFEKIHTELLSNDLVVANLEGPVTDKKSISEGTAPGVAGNYFFTFDPNWTETLFKNNIKIVNLGNNHILNFGREGLASTKKYLNAASVDYFGAPYYSRSVATEIKGIKITFINYNEFSDLLSELEQKSAIEEIQKAKGFSDVIIMFCHWGAEYVGPDQAMKSLARQFIDSGADLVVGSHSHIIGPIETYNEKKIYYSLGNFIFDQYFSEDVRNGLGVVIKIDKQSKQLGFEEKNFYLQSGGQTIEKNTGK